jgi:hypothetical protein
MYKHEEVRGRLSSRSLGRGPVVHLLLNALNLLLVLLLARTVLGERRSGGACLVDDESCVVLLGIPLEPS